MTRTAGCALACAGLLAVGCGSEKVKQTPRPAAAAQLTGVIQNSGVTISPDRVPSKVPVLITISNQTNDAHTVTLEGGSVRETVGPINPMDTATIQKALGAGTYTVKAGSERAVSREIPEGTLRIGSRSANSNNQLNLP